jgi:tetratricopeptide (TPR) repeat protein
MIKKIFIGIFGLLILSISAIVFYKIKTVPEQIIPYPYVLQTPMPQLETENKIALFGDKMGKKLAQYLPTLEESMSKGLAKSIKIEDYTEAHEGLHRTLVKLKSLKSLPKVILYHGGSEEFYEKKFYSNDGKRILRNFRIYDDSTVQTALLFSPFMSHFIYKRINRIDLPSHPMIDDSNYASSELFLRQEVAFKLYAEEFKEFVQYIKSKDSILILISIPYNLDIPPRRVCESSLTDNFKEAKPQIEALKQSGDYKSLLSLLNETIKNNPGNAELYFELGMALKNLGRKPEGITNIELSMAYDCDLWRGGEIYNTIARTIAAKEEIFYFDFSQFIKDQWGMNELFSDDFYPQNVYYEKAMENLGGLLKQQLKI